MLKSNTILTKRDFMFVGGRVRDRTEKIEWENDKYYTSRCRRIDKRGLNISFYNKVAGYVDVFKLPEEENEVKYFMIDKL